MDAVANAGANAAGVVPYTNFVHGIRLEYPAAWKVEEKDEQGSYIVVFLSPREGEADLFLENLNIWIQQLPPNVSLDQYMQVTLQQFQQAHMQPPQTAKAQISGMPAYELVFTAPPAPGATSAGKCLQYALVLNGKSYVITYTALLETFDRYLPAIRAMVASLQLR